MNVIARNVWLDSCLAPLADWLGSRDVTDIFINGPGEIWIERLGGTITRHEAPDLTHASLLRLARQIAAINAQGVSREHPLLAASLPDGSRVQVVLPPATRGTIAIAIRRHVSAALSLDDYRQQGAVEDIAITSAASTKDALIAPPPSVDPIAFLREAVHARRNILISGGTSSGKTTFLNALLREVGREERLILIEDTAELQVSQPNMVGLLAARGNMGEADVTPEDLLIASLRMRPDRIILGEIRGREALTFLRAINTGHPGSMSTIHADSPQGAIDQLAMLILQAGTQLSWENVVHYAARSIDVVVQLGRDGGKRGVRSVWVPGQLGEVN